MEWNKHIIRGIIVLLIQILILNQLQFFGICHPYIFILFLMMMPITISRPGEMILAAAVGLLMDLFSNSLGVHMAACVLLSYLRRPMISNLVMDDKRLKGEINSQTIGKNYLKYAAILVIIYHVVVVMLSAWSFDHLGFNVLQILFSSLISGFMILGYDILQSK